MDPREPTIMQKETVVKDDGRRLIYYRFVPVDETTNAATQPAEREER